MIQKVLNVCVFKFFTWKETHVKLVLSHVSAVFNPCCSCTIAIIVLLICANKVEDSNVQLAEQLRRKLPVFHKASLFVAVSSVSRYKIPFFQIK